MAAQKFYTKDDIEAMKSTLTALPDLTTKRITKSDALSELKVQIVSLYQKKGYTLEDIKSALETAGIQVSVKALREIMADKKTPRKKANKVEPAAAYSANDQCSDNPQQ